MTDRAAEGLALLGIGPGFVQRGLRRATALKADQRPAVIETLHHLGKALALVPKPVVDWNADIVKEDRSAADDDAAQVVEAGAGDAGRIAWAEECRHASGPFVGLSGAGENQIGVGAVGEGDGRLLSVDHVMVAVTARAQLQIAGVRAAARLSQADGNDGFAARHARHPFARHLGPGVTHQYGGVE